MKTGIPTFVCIMLFAVSCHCRRAASTNTFSTRQELEWHGATFSIGMTKAAAQEQLKDAAVHEDFDPKSDATIILSHRDEFNHPCWVLNCVSPEAVGRQVIAKLVFAAEILTRIEIAADNPSVRRSAQGYPNRDEFRWGNSRFRVGMAKVEALAQIKTAMPEEELKSPREGIIRPKDSELKSDIWTIHCMTDPRVGGGTTVRLTFDDDRLRRIQIVAVLH